MEIDIALLRKAKGGERDKRRERERGREKKKERKKKNTRGAREAHDKIKIEEYHPPEGDRR